MADTLGSGGFNVQNANFKRRNPIQISVGDFIAMHRNSEMHKNKFPYEFLESYEVIRSMAGDWFELKKVGSNIVTKAAKEQLRLWPAN